MDNRKTILLVDDEPEILEVLANILDREGYNVIKRPDAESALSDVRQGAGIHLVITDLVMPGMSGSEFVAAVRKKLPNVPVILLTGHGSVESYIRTRSDGVFEYINKPVEAKELRRIVAAAIGD